ncbi:DEAD/DEAH box helicase [Asticcacaulis machinosus]|uniref:DEAD/DEAH box helicase n=1 Tax=Asticcacaulis machinosus TaxID=2984211 RepID=UPI0034A35FD1
MSNNSVTFKDLGLTSSLLMTLEKEGYVNPTPIQAQSIPIVLKGHDLLGIAQTGTGKTAAFALPILHHILTNRIIPAPKTVRVLVLSPTRELATQIADSFKTYSRGMGLQIATIFGGVKYGPQYKALLNGLDILVATPGRLIDHLDQKTVDLRGVEFLVLDEADQMLDLGFVKPIRQIAAKLPHKRQNLFFSATMPKEIVGLVNELLTDPKKVEIAPEATTAERVTQQVIFVEQLRKRALLSELYAEDALTRTLVFTRTKRSADRVTAYLQAGGIEAAAIHGDKNQGQRERALQAFRDGRVRALVATDIAARGIDVDGVTHVINFELPYVAEAYVHRIGRTARAGRSGISITLCADDERKFLKDIERVTRQRIPSFDRRKDQALKLLDEAILASGNTEKPKTPERIAVARHIDGDAERVHKRQRNRPGRNERREMRENGRPERAERAPSFDPMAAEREATAPKRDFTEKKSFSERKYGDKKPFGAKKPFGKKRFDAPVEADQFFDRPARTERPAKDDRPDRRGDEGKRPFAKSNGAKPEGDKKPYGDKKSFGAKKPFDRKRSEGADGHKARDAHGYKGRDGGAKRGSGQPAAEPKVNRADGAQFKRRQKQAG